MITCVMATPHNIYKRVTCVIVTPVIVTCVMVTCVKVLFSPSPITSSASGLATRPTRRDFATLHACTRWPTTCLTEARSSLMWFYVCSKGIRILRIQCYKHSTTYSVIQKQRLRAPRFLSSMCASVPLRRASCPPRPLRRRTASGCGRP